MCVSVPGRQLVPKHVLGGRRGVLGAALRDELPVKMAQVRYR